MKRIKESSKCSSLVVGNIGNFCYLKEGTNRGKQGKTIYQYGLNEDEIKEIEEKYSFTNKSDLEWVEQNYSTKDAERLTKIYHNFLKNRFTAQKDKFFSSMGIDKDDSENNVIETPRVIPPLPDNNLKVGQFIRTAMENLSNSGFVFTDEQLSNLCSVDWCQENLNTGKKIPFAKLHVEGRVNEHRVGKDNVFIKRLFTFGNNSILIKSDLFAYNRDPFVKWYKTLSKEQNS